MKNERSMEVKGQPVQVYQAGEADYLNLVHLAIAYTGDEEGAAQSVSNWIRTRNTMEFLAEWEKLYSNGQFLEEVYEQHAADSSRNVFSMSAQKWVDTTHAVGIVVRRGRNGGVFAHEDIALEFSTWLNPLFKLYVVKEFQRLKQEEGQRNSQDWQLKRLLSKANYRLHTDAVKAIIVDNLPTSLSQQQRKQKEGFIYSSEADVINRAVFGKTAAEWRSENPSAPTGTNIRDFASAEQLVVLSNIESLNSVLLNQGNTDQRDRLAFLIEQATSQFMALSGTSILGKLRSTLSPLRGITSSPSKELLPAAVPAPAPAVDKPIELPLPEQTTESMPAPPSIRRLPSLRDLLPPTEET
jgi:hypothetical protein